MGWFVRFDRFGDTHLCFSQEEGQSCGLASAKMVVFKVNKLRPGKEALTTEQKVEAIYKKYDATAVKVGNEGVFFNMMASVLNEFGIGVWKHAKPPADQIAELLINRLSPDVVGLGLANTLLRERPILLKVSWGSGSHAVVLDTLTKFPFFDACWGAICDPGDGDVHITRITKGQPIAYEGTRVTGSINFWGKPENNYAEGTVLHGRVTEVVYCETPG